MAWSDSSLLMWPFIKFHFMAALKDVKKITFNIWIREISMYGLQQMCLKLVTFIPF